MTRSVRGFEPVRQECLKCHGDCGNVILPKRSTARSSGYDLFVPEYYSAFGGIKVPPKTKVPVWSDVKADMLEDEVLYMFIRSGLSLKNSVELANCVGVVDSDYYSNIDNDGNIAVALENTGDQEVFIPYLDKHGNRNRIAQLIFSKYLITDDDDECEEVRNGGWGHSG